MHAIDWPDVHPVKDRELEDILPDEASEWENEGNLVWAVRGDRRRKHCKHKERHPSQHKSEIGATDVGLDGTSEGAKSAKEESKSDLDQQWEDPRDLEHFPFDESGVAELADAKPCSQVRVLRIDNLVLAEPLLDEKSQRRSRQGKREAQEPEEIDLEVGGGVPE